MDLEDQGRIKTLAEEYGKEEIVVLLGAPTAESSLVQYETVTTGDPSFAGPLAGYELGLEAFHVFEPLVKSLINAERYESLIETLELGLESESIVEGIAGRRAT